jgi:murein DD-endopeptidase MepM/ murein hydrolase activator NlpD
MRHRHWSTDAVLRATLVSFVVGVVAGMVLLALWQHGGAAVDSSAAPPSSAAQTIEDTHPVTAPQRPEASRPSLDPVEELRRRDLLVPVQGVTRETLVDSFRDVRDRVRQHEALDIPAPRGTPVLAVEDGTIEKLFTSERGGLTVYQFDPSRTYAYYYAHLDGYAPALKEHDAVRRGQVLGFVGTTGNAPKNAPHLHIGLFVLTPEKSWWKGTAVNPYDVWVGGG